MLPRSGVAYISVLCVPDGLSKEETRTFVRNNAETIRGCFPSQCVMESFRRVGLDADSSR
jgi:hypothetical protein